MILRAPFEHYREPEELTLWDPAERLSSASPAYANQPRGSALRYSMARDQPEKVLGQYFRLWEFQCRDKSDTVLVHPRLVEALDRIRTHFGRPLEILSAYRTQAHNAAISGAPNSYHIEGMAADIRIAGVSTSQIAAYAAHLLGMGGVAYYKEANFVHVDVGPVRRWQDPFRRPTRQNPSPRPEAS